MRINQYSVQMSEGINSLVKERGMNYQTSFSVFDTPGNIAVMLNDCFHLGSMAEEYVYLLALNNAGKAVGVFEVSHGTCAMSPLSPREIYIRALLSGAVRIVLAHNHPSGNMSPSGDDFEATKRVVKAGKLIGVELLDHLILGPEGEYISLRSERPDLFE